MFGAREVQGSPFRTSWVCWWGTPLGATTISHPTGSTHQRHQLPLLHDLRQHLAPGRARADLGPQEVPGGEVGVAVLLDNLLTLGALPRAGPSCKRPPIQKPRETGPPPPAEDLTAPPCGGGQSPGGSPSPRLPATPVESLPAGCPARLPRTHPPQR